MLPYGDESEAFTHPYLARAWAKSGADLRVPAPGQARKVAIKGSLDHLTRRLIVHTSPTKRSSDFIAHLQQIDHLYGPQPGRPTKPVVLVEDNGPIHTSKRSLAAVSARAHWHLAAIEAYADAAGFEIVETFYDAAVIGADPVTDRPGFAEMLERLLSNGARTTLVESPDRFARDLMVQLAGYDMLKAKGVTLIAASAPTFFIEDTTTAFLVRQVLGAVARFEKAITVAKLAAARKRKRLTNGKCEGRKSLAETRPDVVALAKTLARRKPKGGKKSLGAVAAEIAAQGFLNERGRPFNPKSIAIMLAA